MRKRRTLTIAVCLAIVATALPITASIFLSVYLAADAEREHLAEYANWTLLRAKKNLEEAGATLSTIEREGWKNCSPAHVARMRQLAADAAYVEGIGFLQDRQLKCTGWGPVPVGHVIQPPSQLLSENVSVAVGSTAIIPEAREMLSVFHGRYVAQIKPDRLVDVLRDTQMTLAIAIEHGPLIAVSGSIAPGVMNGFLNSTSSSVLDDNNFASARAFGLVAVAVSERNIIRERAYQEMWVMVPIGILTSGFLIAVIFWLYRQRLSFPAELAEAIKHGEFVPHYQPIVDLKNGLCVGAEALVRWHRPDGNIVGPNVFIAIAEDVGLISAITHTLIHQVARDLKKILAVDANVHVSVNLCAKDLEDGKFLDALEDALRLNGVPSQHVWLEATERGFINVEPVRDILNRARARGHVIAIDDFGTGYSSLSLLEQLPLDVLKIDKSFIDSIDKHAATSVVTPHIVSMAQALNLRLVAEGIETNEQQTYLLSVGVDYGQGWLYSKAMPINEFLDYLKVHNRSNVRKDLSEGVT